jgi:hypothetical protein
MDLSQCGLQSIEMSMLGARFCIQNHSIVILTFEHQFSLPAMTSTQIDGGLKLKSTFELEFLIKKLTRTK